MPLQSYTVIVHKVQVSTINNVLTFSLLMGSVDVVESRHDTLNALAAELSLRARLHNWFGVIGANDAPGLLLDE